MTLQKRVKNDSAKEVAMVKLTEEDVAVDAGAIQLLRCLLLANMCECVKISLDENKIKLVACFQWLITTNTFCDCQCSS